MSSELLLEAATGEIINEKIVVKKNEEQRPTNLIDLLKRNKEVNLTDTCSICLLQVQQETRGYTNTCFHCFCFECIFEWSKVKAICPLCKSQFKLIYYDIKSIDDYKEYKMKSPNSTFQLSSFSSASTIYAINRLPRVTFELTPMSNSFINRIFNGTQLQWFAGRHLAPEQFRLNVYLYKLFVSPNEIEVLDSNRSSANTSDASQQQQINDRTTSIVKPTHYRDIGPDFYRSNIACIHRLVDFLKREISVLKKRYRIQPKSLLEGELIGIIINLVKKFDINSKEFFNSIQNHVKPNHIARHFQHEFYTYARSSSKSLIDYDGQCVYYAVNFTKRVDMSIYRKYDENINITSTHVRTLPPNLSGVVDDLLEYLAKESAEVIRIEDEQIVVDDNDEIEIVPNDGRASSSNEDTSEIIIIPLSPTSSNNSSTLTTSFGSNSIVSSTNNSSDEIIAIHNEATISSSSSSSSSRTIDEFNRSDDENEDLSSYCEEISLQTKPSPDCIYLSSDDDDNDDKPSTSNKRKKSNSEEDYDWPTTSKNSMKRKKRKNLTSKDIVKIKFSSESESSDED